MIKITFYHKGKQADGSLNLVGFESRDHAGYSEHGTDIVCAAVSMLTLNTVNAIDELTDNDVYITFHEDGYLKLMAKKTLDSDGYLLMQAYLLSIRNTYEEYFNDDLNENEFINIKFEEV